MYALRTDDIDGARPRIRHPQRSLVREYQKVFQLQKNLQPLANAYPQYDEINKNKQSFNIVNHQLPQQNKIHKQIQLLHTKLNPTKQKIENEDNQQQKINLQPITIIEPKKTIEQPPSIRSVNLSQSFHENFPIHTQKYSQIYKQIVVEDKVQQQQPKRKDQPIVHKQVPFINYNHIRDKMNRNNDTNYQKKPNQENQELLWQYQQLKSSNQNRNPKYQSKTQRSFRNINLQEKYYQKGRPQSQRQKSATNDANREAQSNKAQKYQSERHSEGYSETKNIFKGLGYNIVTNSNKYPTEMEHKYINRISRWLQ